jgi:parallel beta-helix repeat protein
MFEGWIVENNVVITDHWHGISFYGAINCRIINNTVVDNDAAPSPDPWIMVNNHKNGTPSSGVIVRNNIATDYSLTGGVTTDHNLEITMANAATYFVNPAGGNGDYHLRAASPAIDAGSGSGAPARDKDGALRPQGVTWDIGAYESAPLLALQGALADHAIHLSWTTNAPLSPSATWRITYTGPAGDQASPISGLPEPTRAYVVTGLTNYIPYTVTLNAVLDGTAVLTDTVTVMPTDRWISIPMISR